MADLPESYKPAASHLTDFDPPIYNVSDEIANGIRRGNGNVGFLFGEAAIRQTSMSSTKNMSSKPGRAKTPTKFSDLGP
jgi:hypothetical protein